MFSFNPNLKKDQRALVIDSKAGFLGCLGILFFLSCLVFPLTVFGAESRDVVVSWDYPAGVTDLAGFKIFQDGVEVCSSVDPSLRQMTCNVVFDGTASMFTMTAYNNNDLSSSASVPFQVDSPVPPPVANISPNAIAVFDVVEGVVPLTVNFDGSSSNDPDGTIAGYYWDFSDGTNISSVASGTKVFSSPGLYSAILYVVDDQAASAQVATLITVLPAESTGMVNIPPTADLSASVYSGYAPVSVAFNASGSTDLDGEITAYSWDFGDGDVASGVSVNHTFASSGIYTVRLTVMDSAGDTSVVSAPISVQQQPVSEQPVGEQPVNEQPVSEQPVNEQPVASLSATDLAGQAPFRITFNAADAIDSDGRIEAYYWDFGDGSTADGLNVHHTFDVAGEFTVTLVVTDDLGAMSQTGIVVVISAVPAGNSRPEANFTVQKKRDRVHPNAGVVSGGDSLSLVVEFDASSSFDSDGSIVDFLWDFGDGETDVGVFIEHTYGMSGVYTVVLSVMDDEGATSSVEKVVVLSDAPVAFDGTLLATENDMVQGVLEAGDIQGSGLVFTILTQGNKGSVTLLDPSTGEFVYTPDPGALGVDTFTFQVSDGSLDSNTAAVTISIAKNGGEESGSSEQPVSPFAAEVEGGGGCSIVKGQSGPAQTADWLLVAACLAWLGLKPVLRNKK